MRSKIIKLLRLLECESDFKNEYSEYDETTQTDYFLTEIGLDFPNYTFIVKRFNKIYSNVPNNNIKAELKRMEADGLVMIEVQEGIRYVSPEAPYNDDGGRKFTTESVVLTTKGKSEWRYFLYKATENPISTILSVIATVISIVALFL